jgi:hypothetical protein
MKPNMAGTGSRVYLPKKLGIEHLEYVSLGILEDTVSRPSFTYTKTE